jgi:FkbM family methyltransferase
MRIALLAATLAAASAWAAIQTPARWRLELIELKALGRLPVVGWFDLASRMASTDGSRNGGRWRLGTVALERADLEPPCPVLWATPFGPMRGSLSDEWHLEWMTERYMGLGEDARQGLLPDIRPGDTVVEVGAWIGTFVHYALRRGATRVIAIEPAPDTVECFRRNFAAEIADGRVLPVQAAAWSETRRLWMQPNSHDAAKGGSEGYETVETPADFEVPGRTIDDILAELGIERIDAMNFDIEGGERHALRGARLTIARDAPRIAICIHHLPGDREAILGLLAEIRPDYEVRSDRMHAVLAAPGR